MARFITSDDLVSETTEDILFLKDADGGVWCLGKCTRALNLQNGKTVLFGELFHNSVELELLTFEEAKTVVSSVSTSAI